MDGQFKRLLLQALFSPSSAALGRALQQLRINTAPVSHFLPLLPPGLKDRARLLDNTGNLTAHYEQLREQGWRWIALGDKDYPELLSKIADPPGVLAVRGDVRVLSEPSLAIVGARNASADGLDNSRRFARQLAAAGFVVTSGLALGVDAAAHRGALATGRTVAVLGSGPDRLYPPRNASLANQIADEGGAVVSEFAPGSPPLPSQFPQRNRIISGLSLGTIVVEAAIRSGSLITARTALSQGREVFAIPGSIHNPLSKGCHHLLRDGATWLESMEDIFDAFGDFRRAVEGYDLASDGGRPALLQHLTSGINSLDMLQTRTGLPMNELAGQLADLEMEGWVERVAGGYLKRSHTSRAS
ncbi:DNA-processing protein DprA [Alcanivorax sediminis]|uniref:DNA-protecting protein DprA n=1 Tax=Alcanivorax sediminis TaxID=2663008 RepID=A0A6N7LSZ9_9GAMM|nr:DNA-processing protein DprA [Alcanivorax sediminis]MQX52304.1 DNA-protecting protein DprA [Alcanivorax sediminis]